MPMPAPMTSSSSSSTRRHHSHHGLPAGNHPPPFPGLARWACTELSACNIQLWRVCCVGPLFLVQFADFPFIDLRNYAYFGHFCDFAVHLVDCICLSSLVEAGEYGEVGGEDGEVGVEGGAGGHPGGQGGLAGGPRPGGWIRCIGCIGCIRSIRLVRCIKYIKCQVYQSSLCLFTLPARET